MGKEFIDGVRPRGKAQTSPLNHHAKTRITNKFTIENLVDFFPGIVGCMAASVHVFMT